MGADRWRKLPLVKRDEGVRTSWQTHEPSGMCPEGIETIDGPGSTKTASATPWRHLLPRCHITRTRAQVIHGGSRCSNALLGVKGSVSVPSLSLSLRYAECLFVGRFRPCFTQWFYTFISYISPLFEACSAGGVLPFEPTSPVQRRTSHFMLFPTPYLAILATVSVFFRHARVSFDMRENAP